MPPADGVHGFFDVQAAFYAYVALAIGITIGLWWFGVPTNLTVLAFLAVGPYCSSRSGRCSWTATRNTTVETAAAAKTTPPP
ncbi:hypothetical protein [Halosolutus gelatinilyticus]|uniref:hypothetical protein n=1 Tax=Halosolutus gelatinilyticus TaxID=2931975 RepID=UPI001FF5822E|nr:hypothetical protein [Halosolutus gelatinilyticus]